MGSGGATIGLVLAGGLSRRMGGGDKPLRLVGGETILDRVVARLVPQCDGLVLNANGDPARFAALGLPVVSDPLPDHPGPLAGILAGLDWAAEHRPDAALLASVAGDGPFLPPDLVERLRAARSAAGATIAVAASGGRDHPVIALWPVALRGALREALVGEGLRKVGAFVGRFPVARAEWPTDPVDPFFNANTPDDLAEAERLARL
ncbi:molybdenum cofactor guanylyltransferase MobA [Antarcticirhabdus aurantiaca]|uniref:Molybdenum cofactor guanylyltransferase MobA n=1 Tax=Antarcticirhabdus aurantiaca TaxID=2606717 RepID=A0ACD4NXC3_9HYPH|nr:molybdenum cofactor guanylyltransferase MobA [Antarcticirhabdus aurantiaca]WAJ31485.1 molybdenum cofactor guanylyltransferase MobA [Jeongeuplla avenae]